MSEWKWCENCGHFYESHELNQGYRTRCMVVGCDCKQFYTDPANF